jgi:selenocysteine lyase/cysteine desulfurase
MPTYFNTAAFGLIDPDVKAEADAFYERLAREGSSAAEHWRNTLQPAIRADIAAFIGAVPEHVAMIPNFSWGLTALVHNLRGNERVLLCRGDYPSVTEPFLLNDYAVDWIEADNDFDLPVDTILDRIRRNAVDLVVMSHVQYNSGYTLDLECIGAACREHGAWFVVDATQSLGALPIDVSRLPVDVLISSHYKWMNAGFGTGSMYCSPAFLERYPPKTGGANSYAEPGVDWRQQQPMSGFEPGHPNMYGLSLLQASIRNRNSSTQIAIHNRALTELLLNELQDSGLPLIGPYSMDDRCSILVFEDRDGLSNRLQERDFVVTLRGGRVRISLHHYNSEAEVRSLAAALRA